MAELTVLLAGWGTDPKLLEPLRSSLAASATAAEIWPYEPSGTLGQLSDELGRQVARRRAGDPRLGVHLVGHSLGGLLAAGAGVGTAGVRSVTTINAPWRGTWVGYTGGSPLARQLRWRSPALKQLRGRVADHLRGTTGPRWLVVGCIGDLATPPSTALRPGASGPRLDRRLLPALGHTRSLADADVIATVADHVGPAGRPRSLAV